MFWIIVGVVIALVGVGYAYHYYSTQTTSVLNTAATDVNAAIADVKADLKPKANTVVSNTAPVANT